MKQSPPPRPHPCQVYGNKSRKRGKIVKAKNQVTKIYERIH